MLSKYAEYELNAVTMNTKIKSIEVHNDKLRVENCQLRFKEESLQEEICNLEKNMKMNKHNTFTRSNSSSNFYTENSTALTEYSSGALNLILEENEEEAKSNPRKKNK